MVKGRLHETTLVEPGVAITRQQALATDPFDLGDAPRDLVVALMAVLEDMLDMIRVIDQMNHVRPEPKPYNVAIKT